MQTTQQQPQAAVTVVQQQPTMVSMPANAQPTATKNEKYKKIIRAVAITEVVLGSLSIISGAILTGTTSSRYYRYGFYRYFPTIGQGMWCGVWVLVAGALGIVAGGRNSNPCKAPKGLLGICSYLPSAVGGLTIIVGVNTHMGFAVTASIFAGTQFILDVLTGLFFFYGVNIPFILISALSSFSALILCILSSAYSCKMVCSCCQNYSSSQPIYYSANAQQPMIVQGVPGTTQGYVVQGYQPAPGQVVQQTMQPVMMVQPNYNQAIQQPTGNVAQYHNSATISQNAQATYMNQEETIRSQVKSANSGPPAYS